MASVSNSTGLCARTTHIRRPVGALAYKLGFLSPPVGVVLLLTVFPLIFSLGLTLTDLNLFRPNREIHFVGAVQWLRLIHDSVLWETVGNTAIIVAGGVSLQYVLGLGLALLVDRAFRLRQLVRVFFILPMTISPIAVGFIIGRMMLGEAFGPVNDILHRIGLPIVSWYGTPAMARLTLILVDAWQWTPFMMIVLLAGLQLIPRDALEAARVDGASAWRTFRHITFPLLLPATITALLIRMLELFKLVDIVRVVTGGGPGRTTESVSLYVYDVGVKQGDIAYASTAAYGLLLLVTLVTTLLLLVARIVLRRVSA
jgi:multiple sugar transport system permease protein